MGSIIVETWRKRGARVSQAKLFVPVGGMQYVIVPAYAKQKTEKEFFV